MTWQKLTLTIPADSVEIVGELLEASGAVAVTCAAAADEELYEPAPGTTPLWQCTAVTGLFPEAVDLAKVKTMVAQAIAPLVIEACHTEPLIEQDWQRACMDAFKPVCFSDRLWVYPSWQIPPELDKPSVLLDPGLAFGTGSHPTTALCLEWLAQHLQGAGEVVDYGCGSGILAIAAIKLGATRVWAVDNDPQALEATAENARRNELSEQELFIVDPESLPAVQADVVVANILANPLMMLAPRLASVVRPGGNLVLSGLLDHQEDTVIQAYQNWFTFHPSVVKEGWLCLSAEKKNHS